MQWVIYATRQPRPSVETQDASLRAGPTTYAAAVQVAPAIMQELHCMSSHLLQWILDEKRDPTIRGPA